MYNLGLDEAADRDSGALVRHFGNHRRPDYRVTISLERSRPQIVLVHCRVAPLLPAFFVTTAGLTLVAPNPDLTDDGLSTYCPTSCGRLPSRAKLLW